VNLKLFLTNQQHDWLMCNKGEVCLAAFIRNIIDKEIKRESMEDYNEVDAVPIIKIDSSN
jgi:hypothetical protein